MKNKNLYKFKIYISNKDSTYISSYELSKIQKELDEILEYHKIDSDCSINFYHSKENNLHKFEAQIYDKNLNFIGNFELPETEKEVRKILERCKIDSDCDIDFCYIKENYLYEFKIQIYDKNSKVIDSIELPKTQRELNEILDFYKIDSDCNIDFCYSKENYLEEIMSKNVDIFTLNLLAQKLKEMNDDQKRCFEGMIEVERQTNNDTFTPLYQILNIAESVDKCQCINNVKNDAELARFCYENNLHRELFVNLTSDMINYDLFEKIGKEIRNKELGIYIHGNYIKLAENIEQKYEKGFVPELRQMKGAALLNIKYGDKLTELWLPASDDDIKNISNKLLKPPIYGNDVEVELEDCIAPSIQQFIDRQLKYYSPMHIYNLDTEPYLGLDAEFLFINEFAAHIKEFQEQGKLDEYTAVIVARESIHAVDCLMGVLDLADNIDEFCYYRECIDPATYALTVLKERLPEVNIDLNIDNNTLSWIGEELMQKHRVVNTKFGIVAELEESRYVQQIESNRKIKEGIGCEDNENVMEKGIQLY